MDFNSEILLNKLFLTLDCRKIASVLVIYILWVEETTAFVRREYKKGHSNCSTDENAPLVFKGINLQQFKESQWRLYDITDNYYSCDLGDDSSCDPWWISDAWMRSNSLKDGMTEVLSDERWQDLKVQELDRNKHAKLLSVRTHNESVIPISWSFSTSAELSFCSESIYDNSICLKMAFADGHITLQSEGQTVTLVNGTNWSDRMWRSFLWVIEKGRVRMKKYHGESEINYLADPSFRETTFKHLFGHSTGFNDFVKIHNYNYLSTRTAGFHQIGRPFFMGRGRICISMYVSMCKTCEMIFMMSGKKIAKVAFNEEGTWRNIRMDIRDNLRLYEQLYVQTVGNEFADQDKNYWSIDFVSLCSAVRFISIEGDYECQNPYPKITYKPMNYSISLLEKGDSANQSIDFFRILSVINGTMVYVFKTSDRTEEQLFNITRSVCGIDNFIRPYVFVRRSSVHRCTLWPGYYCGSINANIKNLTFPNSLLPSSIRCDWTLLNENGTAIDTLKFDVNDSLSTVPDQPGLLNVTISGNKNSTFIRWSHPIYGFDLDGFLIEIILMKHRQLSLEKYSTFTEIKKPQIEYTAALDPNKIQPCTEYFIQVRPKRKEVLGFAATVNITTIPFLPGVELEAVLYSKNVTLCVKPNQNTRKCRDKYDNFGHFILILGPEKKKNNTYSDHTENLQNFLNISFPSNFLIIKKFKIGSSRVKSKFEEILGTVENLEFLREESEYCLFNYTSYYGKKNPKVVLLEIFTYGTTVRFFQHKYQTVYVVTPKEDTVSFVTPIIILSVIIGLIIIILFMLILHFYCKIRKRKNGMKMNIDIKTTKRNTIENIYFCGDRVNLLDNDFIESFDKLRRSSITYRKISTFREDTSIPNSNFRPIRAVDFENYLKTSISNMELSNQFAALPSNLTKPCKVGQLEYNIPKNRFKDIIPYDDSRVKLDIIENREGSDYINANYIRGERNKYCYIATQGPKSLTINDFWRMIWQEKVGHIVMLVDLTEHGVKKVEKYWPNYNEDFQFGNIHVYYHRADSLPHYEIRCFRIVCGGKERKVQQYHFKTWPDNGIPNPHQSLVAFIRKTMEITSKYPIVVHCSSGISATAVFILCHLCLQMAQSTGTVDVFKVASQLREQRINMIQNFTHYKLAHLLILDCIGGPQLAISINDHVDAHVAKLTEPENLKLQMEYLENSSWLYRALFNDPDYDRLFIIYPEKNKVPGVHPDSMGCIELDNYPQQDDSSSYINAIRVDGYRYMNRYIVTQQPMTNTLNDFWRMVTQHEVKVIISLNEINLKDKKSCTIWPNEDNPVISPVDFIIMKHHCTTENDNYDVIEIFVMVQGSKMKKSMKVTVAQFKNWKPNNPLPEDIPNYLKFCGFMDSITRQLKNIVVTCYDGYTASGLYVASSYLIETVKFLQNFDVVNAVRIIRRDRPQFITEEKQLAFLYETVATYIKGYQNYENLEASKHFSNIYDYIEAFYDVI